MMITGLWRSLVARLNGVQEAPGSSPGSPTRKIKASGGSGAFRFTHFDSKMTAKPLEKEEPRPIGKVTRPAARTTPCGMAGRGRPKRLSLTEPLRKGSSKAAEYLPPDTSFPNPSRPDQAVPAPDGEDPLSLQPVA